MPVGLPWQEPDDAYGARPHRPVRHDRHRRAAPATAAADFDDVYGDWAEVAAHVTDRRRPSACRVRRAGRPASWPPRTRPRCCCRSTRTRRWPCSTRTAPRWTSWPASPTTCAGTVNGDDITYVVNRNINFSNVCYVGCRFCAFAQREKDADAYRLSVEQVADRAEEAWQDGATEVCMQGGIDPKMPVTGVRRPGPGGEAAGAGDARARVLADGDRHRRGQGRRVRSGSG